MSDKKVIIHWKIDNAEGRGEPLSLKDALGWIKEMNKKYGAGTHWYEDN